MYERILETNDSCSYNISWTKQEEFPWDQKTVYNFSIAAAGMASAFTYFYLRETGVQISWKDFVHYYLSRELVGLTVVINVGAFWSFFFFFTKLLFVLPTQVDHLEVINKQYVKVIPAQGVNTSEVVSYGEKMSSL